VAVLGSAVKEELFGESDSIGQRIKISEMSFEVIGVLKERGAVGIEDYDDQVLLPIRTTQRMTGINHIGLIRARVDSEEHVEESIENIKIILREQHDIRDQSGKSDDFTVRSLLQALSLITTITDGLRYFLTAMAALSLFVGGIGIMNIMLISVTERTREIGLRKALGAKNFDILGQFLLEAVFVTGIGGLVGIVIGVTVSFLIALGVQFAGFEWAFIVSPLSVFLALSVSAGVGLFFGFYPAYKASKLDPIEALRYE
jgi:putative ABC transport system permease protein